MNEIHIDILRLIADHKNIGRADIREMTGADPKNILFKLRAERLIDGYCDNGAMGYWIEPKGTRLLATIDKGLGEIAEPRQMVGSGQYKGEKWVTRQGSEPHAGYRRPMLIASKVMPSKGVV